MNNSFTFKIKRNDVAPSEDGMQFVIKTVNLSITATAEDGFTKEFACDFSLPSPSPASYTPHENVTESMMVGWVTDIYSIAIIKIKEQLEYDIEMDRQRNVIKNYPLPF